MIAKAYLTKMQGTVKWYDKVNCIGFITDAEEREYIFRKKDVQAPNGVFPGLCCLDTVEFTVGPKEKNTEHYSAIKITKLEAYKHGRQR